jgi:hypothetical protein
MENQTGKLISKSFISTFGTSLFTAFFIYILEVIFVVAFTALIYSGGFPARSRVRLVLSSSAMPSCARWWRG